MLNCFHGLFFQKLYWHIIRLSPTWHLLWTQEFDTNIHTQVSTGTWECLWTELTKIHQSAHMHTTVSCASLPIFPILRDVPSIIATCKQITPHHSVNTDTSYTVTNALPTFQLHCRCSNHPQDKSSSHPQGKLALRMIRASSRNIGKL